eukprot:3442855-Amphidinium_carterae.1
MLGLLIWISTRPRPDISYDLGLRASRLAQHVLVFATLIYTTLTTDEVKLFLTPFPELRFEFVLPNLNMHPKTPAQQLAHAEDDKTSEDGASQVGSAAKGQAKAKAKAKHPDDEGLSAVADGSSQVSTVLPEHSASQAGTQMSSLMGAASDKGMEAALINKKTAN